MTIRWFKASEKPRKPKAPQVVKEKKPKITKPKTFQKRPKIDKPFVELPFVSGKKVEAKNPHLGFDSSEQIFRNLYQQAQAGGYRVQNIYWRMTDGSNRYPNCTHFEGGTPVCLAYQNDTPDGTGWKSWDEFLSKTNYDGMGNYGLWGISHPGCTCQVLVELENSANPDEAYIYSVTSRTLEAKPELIFYEEGYENGIKPLSEEMQQQLQDPEFFQANQEKFDWAAKAESIYINLSQDDVQEDEDKIQDVLAPGEVPPDALDKLDPSEQTQPEQEQH